jgi:hypothetical protein
MSTNKDMRLILENWRGYVEKTEIGGLGTIHLFENNAETSSMSFDDLLKEHDKGVISEEKFFQIWEQSTSYDYDLLLQEGVADALSGAFERAKDGAIRIKDTITDAAKAALQKVTSFFTRLLARLAAMIKKGFVAVVKAAQFVWGKIKSFKKKHPILFWIIVALIVAAITAAVYMQLVDPETAQAIAQCAGEATNETVECGGGMALTQSGYEAARGLISEMGQHMSSEGGDPVNIEFLTSEAMQILDSANGDASNIDLSELSGKAAELAKIAADNVEKIVNEMKGGDEQSLQDLEALKDIGQSIKQSFGGAVQQGPTTTRVGL